MLVRPYGMTGVAAANLTGDVVFGLLPLPLLSARMLGMPAWHLYAGLLAATAALVPVIVAVALATSASWATPSLLLVGGSMLVSGFIVLRLVFSGQELRALLAHTFPLRTSTSSGT